MIKIITINKDDDKNYDYTDDKNNGDKGKNNSDKHINANNNITINKIYNKDNANNGNNYIK